jgi:hypothetical protein
MAYTTPDTSREAVESMALSLEAHGHAPDWERENCMDCNAARLVRALLAERDALRTALKDICAVEGEHRQCDDDGCCAAQDLTAVVKKHAEILGLE